MIHDVTYPDSAGNSFQQSPSKKPAYFPYDYQVKLADDTDRELTTERSVIAVMPTGGGKTIVFAETIRRYVAAAKSVLVIAHRSEIIDQTSAKLTANGIPHGVIQAGKEKLLRPMVQVQVASIQTLHLRAIRSNSMLMRP